MPTLIYCSTLNKSEIDPCSFTLAMALANKSAVDNCLILPDVRFNEMVSETINSVKREFSIVSYAFPDNTGCVHTALTL